MIQVRNSSMVVILMLLCCGAVACAPRQFTDVWPNGHLRRLGQVKGSVPVGMWTYFDAEGHKVASGGFAPDGQQDGPWTWFHADGSMQRQGVYQHGQRNGLWQAFHVGGVVSESGEFHDDRQIGAWRWTSPTGTLTASGAFKRGIRSGPWQWWNDEGLLTSSGNYDNGLRVGTWLNANAQEELPPAAAQPALIPATTAALVTTTAAKIAQQPSAAQLRAPRHGGLPAPGILPGVWTPLDESRTTIVLKRLSGTLGETDNPYGITAKPADRQERRLLGKPLPVTRFLGSDGDVLDLDDLRVGPGSTRSVVVVLLRGFSGQICLYCAAQTATLADALPRFAAKNAEVVVVYPGPAETLPAFSLAVKTLRAEPPPFPIALDVNLALAKALEVEGELAKPTALVIAPEGTVCFAYVGIDRADRPSVEDLLDAIPTTLAR